MSQFDAIFAESGKSVLLDHMARSVVYKDPEADDVTVQAIVGPEMEEVMEGDDSRRLRRVRNVQVSTSASDGIADLQAQRHFIIDDQKWRIEAVTSRIGGMATCKCVAGGVLERSRPDYRER